MKVLVTGASGMLGRVLVKQLSEKYDVVGISRSGRNNTVACDLRDPKNVKNLFRKCPFGLVVHSAAYSNVDGCESDPKLAYESNALATKYLSRSAESNKTPLIYISTDYVFDGRKKTPYLENDQTCPINIYGLTKLMGEHYVKQALGRAVIVRTSWLFGGKGSETTFVSAITERFHREKVVGVLSDQRDSPTFVDDLAAAIDKIADRLLSKAETSRKNTVEVFHFCNRGGATRYEMACKIKEYLGLKDVRVEKIEKTVLKDRLALRPMRGVMSQKRYENIFYTKIRSWQESLKEHLESFSLCES